MIIDNKEEKVVICLHAMVGSVICTDVFGCEADIANSARISYGSDDERSDADNERLIKYLYAHAHTSPFEMCEMKFLIKAPIFVTRQFLRHRTASVNELSGRYTSYKKDYYQLHYERLRFQSIENKQASSDKALECEQAKAFVSDIEAATTVAFDTYERLLQGGVAREIARAVLPQSMFTRFFWKIDLHNLLRFLLLRLHKDSQMEIRAFSKVILFFLKRHFPLIERLFVESNPTLFSKGFDRCDF